MVTTTFQRFTIKHLAVINNITCLSSKSTPSSSSSSPAIRTICSVQSMKLTSSLPCKSLSMGYNNIDSNNNYLNCNLPSSRNHLINLRLYSTDNNKHNQPPQHQHQHHHHQQQQQQQSNVSSESDLTLLQPDKIVMRYVDELIDFRDKKPTRTWLTVIKVLITMFAGVNFGAFMAKLGATLLEKYEIFVRDEDDSDD